MTQSIPEFTAPEPTRSWTCDCGATVERYRGQDDVSCPNCDQLFNTFGQKLRDDWASNPSTWDEDISDLDGYELSHVDDF